MQRHALVAEEARVRNHGTESNSTGDMERHWQHWRHGATFAPKWSGTHYFGHLRLRTSTTLNHPPMQCRWCMLISRLFLIAYSVCCDHQKAQARQVPCSSHDLVCRSGRGLPVSFIQFGFNLFLLWYSSQLQAADGTESPGLIAADLRFTARASNRSSERLSPN